MHYPPLISTYYEANTMLIHQLIPLIAHDIFSI